MPPTRLCLALIVVLLVVDRGAEGAAGVGGSLRGGQRSNASSLAGPAYNHEEALLFAHIAAAAFCEGIEPNWDCVPCRSGASGVHSVRRADSAATDAHGYAARLGDGRCVVAFRGTKSAKAWEQDLKSLELVEWKGCSHRGRTCKVGRGFLENYLALREPLLSHLEAIGCSRDEPLAVAGHSLGGAVASLAMWDLARSGYHVASGYTFGQPRVGDGAWAGAFREALSPGATLFRLTQFDDPVPLGPVRGLFEHVGTEVYFWDRTTFQICEGSQDPQCSVKHESTAMILGLKCALSRSTCGHRTYFFKQRPFLSGC